MLLEIRLASYSTCPCRGQMDADPRSRWQWQLLQPVQRLEGKSAIQRSRGYQAEGLSATLPRMRKGKRMPKMPINARGSCSQVIRFQLQLQTS